MTAKPFTALKILQAAGFSLLFSASSSVAAAGFDEGDLFREIPSLDSASRIPQSIDSTPISASVIDRELIQAAGVVSVTDLFKLIPGFQVYPVNYNKQTVTYHGMSDEFSSQLDVRVNGRPIYLPLLATVSWSSLGLTLDDIDRIEVIRGSNVPAFGSNTFTAAINIITRSALEQQQQLTTTFGDDGTRNTSAVLSAQGDDISGRLSLNHQENNGYSHRQDGFKSDALNLSLHMTPTLFDSVALDVMASQGYTEVGRNVLTDRDESATGINLRWQHIIDNHNESQLMLYRNQQSLSSPTGSQLDFFASRGVDEATLEQIVEQLLLVDQLGGTNFSEQIFRGSIPTSGSVDIVDSQVPVAGENGVTQTYGLEWQHRYSSDKFTVASGIGSRYDRAKSESLFTHSDGYTESANLYYLFSNQQWALGERWLFNSGVMVEDSSITAKPSTSARVAARYKLRPNLSLRFSHSDSERLPSLFESNGSTAYVVQPYQLAIENIRIAPDNLKPEDISATELGLFWQLPKQLGHLDLKLFYDDVDDAITSASVQTADVRGLALRCFTPPGPLATCSTHTALQSGNNANWISKGFEAQLLLRPSRADLINLAYSYNRVTGLRERVEKPSLTLSHRAPRHTMSMLYNHRFSDALDASVNYYFRSAVSWRSNNVQKSYGTTDLALTHRLPLGDKQQLTSRFIVKNVFDKKYVEYQEQNIAQRQYYLSFSIEF